MNTSIYSKLYTSLRPTKNWKIKETKTKCTSSLSKTFS